jgi:quercetin dioxygenase-like cupin family protein
MDGQRDTNEVREGAPDGVRKVGLFESPRFFLDVHVLRPGQAQRVHVHDVEDKVVHVLSGTVRVTSGDDTFDAGPGVAVHFPPGVPHAVRNAGDADVRLLVFMAPHPRPPVVG